MLPKISLVSGSAVRIGKSIALQLAEMGHHIILHYGKSKIEVSKTLQEVRDYNVEVVAYSADLSKIKEIENLVDQIENSFGRLNYLFNNAASFIKEPFSELSEKSWNASIDVNLKAPVFLSKFALPLLQKANGDKMITNIADLSGIHPWNDFIQHGISKAGLLQFTRSLARTLAPDIRVNAILPGPMLPAPGMTEKSNTWQEIQKNIPMKKAGGVKPIQQTIKYLVENEYLTGSIINVDGGENLVGPANH